MKHNPLGPDVAVEKLEIIAFELILKLLIVLKLLRDHANKIHAYDKQRCTV